MLLMSYVINQPHYHMTNIKSGNVRLFDVSGTFFYLRVAHALRPITMFVYFTRQKQIPL